MTVDELIALAGGAAKLAEWADCPRSTIYGWLRRGRVPIERAWAIHEKRGIPLHEIRPDVWREEQFANIVNNNHLKVEVTQESKG